MAGWGQDDPGTEFLLPRLLHGGRKWGAVVRLGLPLRRAAQEEAGAQAPEGEAEVHHVTHGHEGHGDDDEQAEGLRVGRQDHHDEVEQV